MGLQSTLSNPLWTAWEPKFMIKEFLLLWSTQATLGPTYLLMHLLDLEISMEVNKAFPVTYLVSRKNKIFFQSKWRTLYITIYDLMNFDCTSYPFRSQFFWSRTPHVLFVRVGHILNGRSIGYSKCLFEI